MIQFDVPGNPTDEATYECLRCGQIVTSHTHPSECDRCGGGFQNRALSLE